MPLPQQLVVCALGAEQYGLPIERVREIVRYADPRPVAADDPAVRGVIGLRGRLLPVLDLGARLGLGPAPLAPKAKIVVVEAGAELAGVVVDDVVEVAALAPEQVEEVPAAAAGGRAASVARLGDRLVLLLDAGELLAAGAAAGAAPAGGAALAAAAAPAAPAGGAAPAPAAAPAALQAAPAPAPA